MKNRIPALLLALSLIFTLCACAAPAEPSESAAPSESVSAAPSASPEESPSAEPSAEPEYEPADISVGVLKGPTGIGAVKLMDDAASGAAANNYDFTLASAPTDLTALVINGELDICALPTNVAATLYNKTEGGVKLLALNTLGVLYILENGETVTDIASLAGKTVYAAGQGSNPEYVLNFILRENGLEPGEDVTVEYRDSEELSALMAAGEIDLCMLPVPAATAVMMKNADVRAALDLTEEWDKISGGSALTMGCIVVNSQFAAENPAAAAKFVEEYAASVSYVLQNAGAASELVAKYEITGSAAIALAAIPDCNLVCVTGGDMQLAIEGYYEVLLAAAPDSIGGAVPGNDFYYIP